MIYDVHQHLANKDGSPQAWRAAMRAAGIQGGALFSQQPAENNLGKGPGFEERLSQVLEWCAGCEDTDPVLFIHPSEPDACERAKEAVARGIAGFKMICNNYRVGDERALRLIETIAGLDKPLFFHSGIIWNSEDSSRYNRPVEWEALLGIKGLRFSLAHCSWPWYDECIAVYGKFAHVSGAPEMFFDLTPGTPPIYRKDLLYKLFNVGYDVEDNILFGVDCIANDYGTDYAAGWIQTDNAIYDELGISEAVRRKVYCDNYLRFIGRKG